MLTSHPNARSRGCCPVLAIETAPTKVTKTQRLPEPVAGPRSMLGRAFVPETVSPLGSWALCLVSLLSHWLALPPSPPRPPRVGWLLSAQTLALPVCITLGQRFST